MYMYVWTYSFSCLTQGTKKFRSDSPGLADFVVGLEEFIVHLLASKSFQRNFSFKLNDRSTVKHENFSG